MLPFHTFSLGFSFMKIACMTPLGTGVQYDEVTCLQHPRKLLASPPHFPRCLQTKRNAEKYHKCNVHW